MSFTPKVLIDKPDNTYCKVLFRYPRTCKVNTQQSKLHRILSLKHLTLAICCFTIPLHANANTLSDSTPMTHTIKQAIEHDPNVNFKWHAFLASGQAVNASRAGFRPNIDLTADYGIETRDYGPNETFNGGNINLQLTQILLDGQRTRHSLSNAESEKLASYFEFIDALEQTTLEAFNAYQDVMRYREIVRLAEDNRQIHAKIFDQIQSSVNSGATRRVDLEQAQGRLALAENNLLTEISNLHDVSARYLRLVGALPNQELQPFNLSTDINLPANFEIALESAYTHNPSFHASLRNIDASGFQLKRQQSENSPQLNLAGRYGARNYDQIGNRTNQQDGRISLEFTYNFYSGGKTQAEIARASDELNVAKTLHYKTCVDMRQTLQIAYNDTIKLAERLPNLEKHALSSNNVRVAYLAQFDIGQRTLLDLLDSENEHFEANRAYTNASYDLEIAYARTLASMGQLLKTLNVVRDQLPTLEDLGSTPYNLNAQHTCPTPTLQTEKVMTLDSDNDGVPDHLDMCPNTPTGTKVNDLGCTIHDEFTINERIQVSFDMNSSIVNPDYMSEIERIALLLNQYPTTKLVIEGHSSLIGSAEYNLWLSDRRAGAIRTIMINNFGIDPTRIEALGYGITKPIINAQTPQANKVNQRIEAIISNQHNDANLQ